MVLERGRWRYLSGGDNEEELRSMSRRHEEARFGGAERVRTAASQFCRLLPYHLGTAPRKAAL